MKSRAGVAVATAIAAESGALAGAIIGFFGGAGLGALIGLPRYRLGGPDEGFDQLDLGLILFLVCWVLGAAIASWLMANRSQLPHVQLAVSGSLILALLGFGAGFVGSATADWYDPLVFLAGPFFVMGALAYGTARRGRATSSPPQFGQR